MRNSKLRYQFYIFFYYLFFLFITKINYVSTYNSRNKYFQIFIYFIMLLIFNILGLLFGISQSTCCAARTQFFSSSRECGSWNVKIICKIARESHFLYFNILISMPIDEKSISAADSTQISTLKQLRRLFIKITGTCRMENDIILLIVPLFIYIFIKINLLLYKQFLHENQSLHENCSISRVLIREYQFLKVGTRVKWSD